MEQATDSGRKKGLQKAVDSVRIRMLSSACCKPCRGRAGNRPFTGFTLIELLLAVAILSVVTTVTFLTFSTVLKAWQRGLAISGRLHYGDFVLEQLVTALRSAYYRSPEHGFQIEDNGDGQYESDVISWVKVGGALVGTGHLFAGPHRVKFWVEENERGSRSVAVKAWRLQLQPEDFDPEKDVETVFLTGDDVVTGFNCRMADRKDDDDEEIEWFDEWEDTNRVPELIEATLYLRPLDEQGAPVEVRRLVSIRPLTEEKKQSARSRKGPSGKG